MRKLALLSVVLVFGVLVFLTLRRQSPQEPPLIADTPASGLTNTLGRSPGAKAPTSSHLPVEVTETDSTATPTGTVGHGQRTQLSLILSEADPVRRAELIQAMTDATALDDIPGLLREIENIPGADSIRDQLARRWATESPAEAARWVEGTAPGPFRTEMLKQVATVWADTDLDASLAWVQRFPIGEDRDAATQAVGFEAARTDPLAALNLAAEMSPGGGQDELVVHGARQWADTDPAGAAAWAETIEDDSLRHRTLTEIAAAWATTDPRAAADYALATLPAGQDLSDVAIEILKQWSAKEPAAAADWAAQFPPGELQSTAFREALSPWTEQNPAEVARWIEQLATDALKDQGRAAYAIALAEQSPTAAITAAESISDAGLRLRQLEQVAGRWLDLDPAAAGQWIRESALPDESRGRLLAPPPAE